jgi:hypothetical protein
MGLPMTMDSTSVPSGPSSWHGTDGSDYGALTLTQLLEKKTETETELKQLSGVLETVSEMILFEACTDNYRMG